MSMENVIPFEELDRKRKKSSAKRLKEQDRKALEEEVDESSAMAVINEIFNPKLKIPETHGHYTVPDVVHAGDVDALKDLDERKLVELKEVFLLFDTDSDGLISREDLRITFLGLGGEAPDELLDQMMKEAKEPLDYDAFVQLMGFRTIELDPEDVLLEAWSKWDDHGTGLIAEKNCVEYVELFPYLKEPVIENTTTAEHTMCHSHFKRNASLNYAPEELNEIVPQSMGQLGGAENVQSPPQPQRQHQPQKQKQKQQQQQMLVDVSDSGGLRQQQLFSGGRIYGLRVIFKPFSLRLNSTASFVRGEYAFLDRANFENDGRLIPGTFCDYYFFAEEQKRERHVNETNDVWKYFHSPRYPANYAAHIQCSYKFIGRPDTRVEVVFEELLMPKNQENCNLDKVTIYDAESPNVSSIVDVICEAVHNKRIFSNGPDLLIEFNASSNQTTKGFRGKFKFVDAINLRKNQPVIANPQLNEVILLRESHALPHHLTSESSSTFPLSSPQEYECDRIFDSKNTKNGTINSPLYSESGFLTCRYEFKGDGMERVQIKFYEFSLPRPSNRSDCENADVLQLFLPQRGRYELEDTFCGPEIPKPIMSAGSMILLKYMSRRMGKGTRGFKAEYRFVKNFGITTGEQMSNHCVFAYNSSVDKVGWFTSPNFPGSYPKNIKCNYYFFGQSSERVNIRFTFFDVEGIYPCEDSTASDYVEFSNFMSTDRKFAKMCGKKNDIQVRSDGRFFRVTFFANDRFDKTGFKASYEFETKMVTTENTSLWSAMVTDASSSLKSSLQLIAALVLCQYSKVTRYL